MTRTYILCADTHWYLFHSEYPVQWIEHSLTYEFPNHDSVRHVKFSWIEFSLTQWFGLRCENRRYYTPRSCRSSWKGISSKLTKKWENNIRNYCISNTEINISLLHWNKQHLESGIIKWWCRFLDEYFQLLLVFTCFESMHICHRVGRWAIWSTPWREINQHLPSKKTSARGGKSYWYNGSLNFFTTCSSAFWRLTSSSSSMS